MSEENMVYNIAGWSVTLPANWPFLVDAEMPPPQYIYEEPFGRVMVCCSSCAFHDITTDMAPTRIRCNSFFARPVSKWECGRPVWRLGIRRASPRWLIAVSRGMAGRWWALAFARLAAC